CTRLALDADIDHTTPWAHGGPTNIRQLRPLCPPDHTHRHHTKLAYRTRDNGTVEVTTPTGFTSTEPPPF
ncbi:HNH endonuclease signature motif containing protein, partial [Microbacterium sp. NPDC055357]